MYGSTEHLEVVQIDKPAVFFFFLFIYLFFFFLTNIRRGFSPGLAKLEIGSESSV